MSRKTLLVADDVEMNRALIRKFVEDEYEVLEAANGTETMEALKTQRIDILLLDIIMPEMDGLEVLRQLRSTPELGHVGVLVATSTKEKTERAALAAGADDIVSKPYDPIVIRKRLENIIAKKETEHRKNLAEYGEIEHVLELERAEIFQRLEQVSTELKQTAALIQKSAANQHLVMECAKDINKHAEDLLSICRK